MSSATPASTKTSTSPIFWQVMPMAPACIWSFPMAGILWVLMCGRLPIPCLARCACTRRMLFSMMSRRTVTAGVSRSPTAVMRGLSARRVAATGHAGVERALVIRATVGQGALLLRHVPLLLRLHLLLLLLPLVGPPRPSDGAEERAHAGADGRALSRVAADRAADGAEGSAAHGS